MSFFLHICACRPSESIPLTNWRPFISPIMFPGRQTLPQPLVPRTPHLRRSSPIHSTLAPSFTPKIHHASILLLMISSASSRKSHVSSPSLFAVFSIPKRALFRIGPITSLGQIWPFVSENVGIFGGQCRNGVGRQFVFVPEYITS